MPASRRTRLVVADDHEPTRVLIATIVGLLGEVDQDSHFAGNGL
jgi:hypothetical protein